ncbi:nuclease-related domain-containing protein [Robertmurraya siralis]|uniref:nuclease-related domain-containing protein n=1 Tax=Robertmurraya siralis TaxID=77777 RepID=UPI001BB43E1F|nr:nuclease-related domain-containing protein [Robertmurraya siralis]
MYVKELSKPVKISVLEVLLKRLVDNHPKQSEIERDLTLLLAGYKGEKAVSYYLDFLPEKNYYIFHSLRLPSNGHYFQMDYLLLTTRFALILECKNFFGTLFFDQSFHQLIRTVNDKEEGFQDPLSQVKWHQHQLQNLFHTWRCPLPIEYFVVIGNLQLLLKRTLKIDMLLLKLFMGIDC